MRILIAGGAGFLGRHIAQALATEGETVSILDDLSCTNSSFETPELLHPGIECIRGSTFDRALLRRLVQNQDMIFHLASVVGVEETIRHPYETMRNLEGTLNLLEALRPSQAVLFTSSADVYGLHSHLYDRPMREDDLQLFESSNVNRWIYPKIKALEENAIVNGPCRGIVVRVFNCFGPGMDFPHGKRVVPQFIERILTRQPLQISGTGEQQRALCYYTDTVRGLLLAMRYLLADAGAPSTVVNIGSTETWTILKLAETLQNLALELGVLDEPLPIERNVEIYSQAFDDSWHRTPDLERAGELLGYYPSVPAREGLRQTLEFYSAGRHLAPSTPRQAAAVVMPRARQSNPRRNTDVLILGGGISGLACRAGLAGNRETLLLEAENEVGGLLRMDRHGDFIFDSTVHAVHFNNSRLRQLFDALLPSGFHEFEKHNLVWQAGRVIDYPYQFHLHQLPADIRDECIASVHENPGRDLPKNCTFETWLLEHFGRGLYEHFFAPYNTKLYGVHPSLLEAAPMVWTIPVDNRAAILAGVDQTRTAGEPSRRFLYPRGPQGISALVSVLAGRSADPLLCGERVVSIDPERRIVETNRGLRVRYRELVSSLPLPTLVGMCQNTSVDLQARAATLEAAAITVVQVGVHERLPALEAHWTYFPDSNVPFYRLTRLERISPDLCPEGSSALLLECPGNSPPAQEHVLATLVELGVISTRDVDWYGTRCIPYAYVLFRRGFAQVVTDLCNAFEAHGIRSIGRYGEWRYSNIEQCIASGLDAAQALTPIDVSSVLYRPPRPGAEAWATR